MINFAISMVILALCSGAQQPAKAADAKAKADGAHCAMHAKADKADAAGEKACCAKHDAKAAKTDAAHAAKHADAKHAAKACCAKHGKDADAAHKGSCDHAKPAAATADARHGASCNHDAKPAATADAKAAPAAKTAAYVCPMHADITSETPADCSKCGMKLVEKKS